MLRLTSSPEVMAVRKTCFVCYGDDGPGRSLTYHELSTKTDGEEFFAFILPSAGKEEALKELYRWAVSASRLGHPLRYFRGILEKAADLSSGSGNTAEAFDGSLAVFVLRRGEKVYIMRSRDSEVVHFDATTGDEGTTTGMEGVSELRIPGERRQADLFERSAEEHFALEKISMIPGNHTLLIAPSREFVKRNRDALLDSVFFPSFRVPEEEGLGIDADSTFPAIHWQIDEVGEKTVTQRRGTELMKTSIPVAAGAIALLIAIIFIFRPFGGEESPGEGGDVLLNAGDQAMEEAVRPGGEEVEENLQTLVVGRDEDGAGENGEGGGREDPGHGGALDRAGFSLTGGWKKKFGGPVTSSPSFCGGKVVFGCRDGKVYAYSPAGEPAWSYSSGAGIGASPACAGGDVFGADYNGSVFSLDLSSGERRWLYKAGAKIVSSPVVMGSSLIVCTMDGRVISLVAAGGERKWSQKIGEAVWATPCVTDDALVTASTDGSLIRMNVDGDIEWRVAPGGEIYSSPLCIEDRDLVVVGTNGRYVFGYALGDGSLMWRYGADGEVRSAPVTDGERIYAGTEEGSLVALDMTGRELWKVDTGGAIRSKPLISGEVILVTSYSAKIYAYSTDEGELLSEYRAESALYSSPAYASGRVFFGSNDGFLHAVRTE